MIKTTVEGNILYISTSYLVSTYALPDKNVLFKYLSKHGVSDYSIEYFTKTNNSKAMISLAITILNKILLTKYNKLKKDMIIKFIKVYPSTEYFLIIKQTMEDKNNDRINLKGIRVYKKSTKLAQK
jgi:hypothetical protein